MNDCVNCEAVDRLQKMRQVVQIALHIMDTARRVALSRSTIIADRDLLVVRDHLNQRAAEETAAACNEYCHALFLVYG